LRATDRENISSVPCKLLILFVWKKSRATDQPCFLATYEVIMEATMFCGVANSGKKVEHSTARSHARSAWDIPIESSGKANTKVTMELLEVTKRRMGNPEENSG
jgi:hypothetical protein